MTTHRGVAPAHEPARSRAGDSRRPSASRRCARAALALAAAIAVTLLLAGAAWATGYEVVSWGNNASGELGKGSLTPTTSNVPLYVCAVSGCNHGTLKEVIAVSAGGEHSLALLANHELVAWGRGQEGALGDGLIANTTLPVYVCAVGGCGNGHLKGVIAISAGDGDSNIALLENHEVVTWGANKAGQLGNGTLASNSSYSTVPVKVCAPSVPFSTSCTTGAYAGDYLENASAVSAAPDHDAAIMQPNGELLTWGVNERGQIGQGNWSSYIDTPRHVCEVGYPYVNKVLPNTAPHCPSGHYLTGVESITFGLEHNIAQFSGAYCVRIRRKDVPAKKGKGEGEEEGKGNGEGEGQGEGEGCAGRITKKEAEEGYEWIQEYAAYSVVAFGNNEEGQLGDGLPAEKYGLSSLYAPHTGGPAYCKNEGSYPSPCSQVPVHVCEPEFAPLSLSPCGFLEYLEPVTDISAGGAHSLALKGSGEVLSWGSNQYGTAGNGANTGPYTCSFKSNSCSPVPHYVCNTTCSGRLTGVTAISGGSAHDLALSGSKGEVYAWGDDSYGQLGDGPTGTSYKPAYVCQPVTVTCPGHLTGVKAISAGSTHSLAIGTFALVIKPCEWCYKGKGTPIEPYKGGGILGEHFVGPLHGSGGELPYKWSLGGGSLPKGLTLEISPDTTTATIVGTPTEAGSSTFNVEMTDSGTEPETTSESITITVIAPPDLGRCVTAGGATEVATFTDKGCTKAAGEGSGKYEWLPGVEKAGFTTASTGPVTLETTLGERVSCTGGETGGGEYSGTGGLTNVHMTFIGCQGSGSPCTTAGAGPGELETSALEGEYGWESKPKKVALDLYPAGKLGAFLEYSCGEGPLVTVDGSVLAPVSSGKMATTATLKYAGKKGKQKPSAFEGGETDVLVSSMGERVAQASLTFTETQTSEEAVEINPAA
ncbi:MAG TPA: putative Ig domain-containing protein [Solirubrobacteraceae bacterium]|nr:putative Ig domain-containing protein [Solirubrobacteraceae bacterium]